MGVQVKAGLIAVGVIVLMVGGYFVVRGPPPIKNKVNYKTSFSKVHNL